VGLVRTDVSEEGTASIIGLPRLGELGTLAVIISPIPVTLMIEATRFSEMSVLTRATRRYILEYGILHNKNMS
jgi:hypothetical protein